MSAGQTGRPCEGSWEHREGEVVVSRAQYGRQASCGQVHGCGEER